MLADLIVRSAYQMGKTPLLPIFAALLGASDLYLGFIISVSTLTGMILKPTFGLLSDRWGRRLWLLIGTVTFALMPFMYRWITTPEQLVAVRLIHGLATAIYGPVTLAYVSELASHRRAERLGWFGLARSTSYIVGPAAAGWLLLSLEPATVFTVIGAMSTLAFLPVLSLPEPRPRAHPARVTLQQQIRRTLTVCRGASALWLAGAMESAMYIATYAVRAFLPLYALGAGVNVVWVGSFFSIQEATHILTRPWGGRLGDRLGYLPVISLGMALFGLALLMLTYAHHLGLLILVSLLIGVAQALLGPSTAAFISEQVAPNHLGAIMGLVGTLGNLGKVVGPILAGALIYRFDYAFTFHLIGGLMFLGIIVVWIPPFTLWQPPERMLSTGVAGEEGRISNAAFNGHQTAKSR